MPPNLIGVALRKRRAGFHTLAWALPSLQAPENFVLTSTAFDGGTSLPRKYQGKLFGENLSPAISWTAPPEATSQLVLIVQDPDVPFGKPATHLLVVVTDPSLRSIPENGLAYPSSVNGLQFGKGALGRRGWLGPKPPRSHGPHSYVFQLFAVDAQLYLEDPFRLVQVVAAMAGHVIARARLEGIYEIS